jgi:hypothetical protein
MAEAPTTQVADVDRVSPGVAYDKWRQAPEYQEGDELMAGIVGAVRWRLA